MNGTKLRVTEEWRRAPRALLERIAAPASASEGTAHVALYAKIPESAERAGVRFSLDDEAFALTALSPPNASVSAAAGISTDDPGALLFSGSAGPRGTLEFPAGFAAEGEYVTVSATVARPLRGASSSDASGGKNSAGVGSGLSIIVRSGAEASVFLQYGGEDDARALYLSTLDIAVEENGKLELFIFAEGGSGSTMLFRSAAALGGGARLIWTEASFGSGPARWETRIDLAGEGAESEFFGAHGARGRTERERVLTERHLAPRTRSRAVLKSVLREEARLAFRGLIEVRPEAPGTDAYLSNRNLLLDDGARAESLPQLKIDQDDVACSHGSTTGGLREEELFYLMSRGLDKTAAKSMIALGHLESILDKAPADLAPRLEAASRRVVEA